MYIVNSEDIRKIEEIFRSSFYIFDYEFNQTSLLQNSNKDKVIDFSLFFYKKFFTTILKKVSSKYYCDIILQENISIKARSSNEILINQKEILSESLSNKKLEKIFFGYNENSINKKLRILLYVDGFQNFINSLQGTSVNLIFQSFDENQNKWVNRGFVISDLTSKETYSSFSDGIFYLNQIKTSFSSENELSYANIGTPYQRDLYNFFDTVKKYSIDYNYIFSQENLSLIAMHLCSGKVSAVLLKSTLYNEHLMRSIIDIAYDLGAKFINLNEQKEIKNKKDILNIDLHSNIIIASPFIFNDLSRKIIHKRV